MNCDKSPRSCDFDNLVSIKCQNPSLSYAKLATVNARSLNANVDLISPIIRDLNIDLLCLTETWLRPEDEFIARAFTPAAFTLFRADRHSKKGGGVAILCHAGMQPKVIQTA